MRKVFTSLAMMAASVFAGESPPILMQNQIEKATLVLEQAKEKKQELAEKNLNALKRLAHKGINKPDPTLWLWAEREIRVYEKTPFCNLSQPKSLSGYPEELENLSRELRGELTAFHQTLLEEKNKLIANSEQAFDHRVRSLVRSDEIEQAVMERDAFKTFPNDPVMKKLESEIQQLEKLLSGKSLRSSWKNSKKNQPQAPPDALFVFEAGNPAFIAFQQQVKAISNGSPHRGQSGIRVGINQHVKARRGLSLLAYDGNEEILNAHYDTYESKTESLNLVKDIANLPYGTFIVIVAHDDATRRFSGEAQSALLRLGAEEGISGLPYRSAYLLIGIKGLRPGGAVEIDHPESLLYPPK